MLAVSKEHVLDIGPEGLIGHDSSKGNVGTKDRMRRHG